MKLNLLQDPLQAPQKPEQDSSTRQGDPSEQATPGREGPAKHARP